MIGYEAEIYQRVSLVEVVGVFKTEHPRSPLTETEVPCASLWLYPQEWEADVCVE